MIGLFSYLFIIFISEMDGESYNIIWKSRPKKKKRDFCAALVERCRVMSSETSGC